MPDIINVNDSEELVRAKIIAILQFDGVSTDGITSWGAATNRLNLAANRLELPTLENNMAGGEARARINALAVSPAPVYPENTVAPVVSGLPRLNQTLTATTGTWNGYPVPVYTYQWQADGVNIEGATSSSYVLTENELGKVVRVGVIGSNGSGYTTAFSDATTTITSIPINTTAPSVSGTAANGQTLTASNGSWTAFPVPTYSYQWKADGVNITGATNQSLILGNSHIGKAISIEVTATNSEGNASSSSVATSLITSAPINTVAPIVAAEAVEGTAISTTNGVWLGYPAITYTYEWKRNGVNIAGATSSTYTISGVDVGQNISVSVTATNSIGNVTITTVNKMAKPAWAATFDNWRDFTTNLGDLQNPADTHSSVINAQNSSGVYSSFPANTLVRTDLGLQTVPTRVNSLRNSSMVGAAVGVAPTTWSINPSQAGIACSVVGVGVEDGLPYLDVSFVGTANSTSAIQVAFEQNIFVVANSGETWTSSFFVKLISGTPLVVRSVLNQNMVDGSYIREATSAGVTTSSVRSPVVLTTILGANTVRAYPFLKSSVSPGQALNSVIRIYTPQLEQGTFATPPTIATNWNCVPLC